MGLMLVSGCVATRQGNHATQSGFSAADEPQAAMTGSAVLAAGGNAADAAAAMGLALAVTMPSRAGLTGGGLCLIHDPAGKTVRTLDFLPRPARMTAPADRPAATAVPALPALPRGLFALQAKYGRLRWERLVVMAETMARSGIALSRAFVQDLRAAAGPLAQDAEARRLFLAGGQPPAEGSRLTQPELADTLAQLRQTGVGGFYGGAPAGALAAGLDIDPATLRAYQPAWRATVAIPLENDIVHFAALDGPGATATPDGWRAVIDAPVTEWPRRLLGALERDPGLGRPAAAGATLAVLDADEQAVACTLTMGGLFGSGHVIPGTGLFTARADDGTGIGGPAVMMNPHLGRTTFIAAAGAGSDGETAGSAPAALVATALQSIGFNRPPAEALATIRLAPGPAAGTVLVENAPDDALSAALGRAAEGLRKVPALGRVSVAACSVDKATGDKRCLGGADPRGPGLAVRNDR